METPAEPSLDKEARLKEHRKMRRIYLILAFFFAVVMAPLIWFGSVQDAQQDQDAAEYRQDCARPGAATPGCQKLTMQVYERRKEVYTDPEMDDHWWLGLRGKSGPTFEVDTDNSQWDRIAVGTAVTATVWNGEVEEVTDNGGTEKMKTNPVRITQDRGLDMRTFGWVSAMIVCLLLAYVAVDKLGET